MHQPGVTSAIAGSGDLGRAADNARAAEVDLSGTALQAVDDLILLVPEIE
jgi:aryl-alcohol dehydrogenase-like predicted oxidoreductase